MTIKPPSRVMQPPMQHLPSAPNVNWPPRRSSARSFSNKKVLVVASIAAGSIVALGVFILAAVVIGRAVSHRIERDAAFRDLSNQSEDLRARALAQLDTEDGLQLSPDQASRTLAGLERAADTLSGTERDAMRAAVDVVRHMQQEAAAYQALVTRLATDASINPSGLSSVGAIDKRMEMVRQADAANTKLTATIQSMPDRYRAELTKSNIPQQKVDEIMRGFQSGLKSSLLLQIREEERKGYASMLKLFGLFKREWNRWSFDQASETVSFERPSAANEYNRLIEELQSAAARQTSLQRAFLSR